MEIPHPILLVPHSPMILRHTMLRIQKPKRICAYTEPQTEAPTEPETEAPTNNPPTTRP